jgi:hypothetical protein
MSRSNLLKTRGICSARMYKARFRAWGLPKYLREAEVRVIARAKVERDAAGKESQVVRSGTKVEFSKVARHLERKKKSHLLEADQEAGASDVDARKIFYDIEVVTPPRSIRSPEPVHNIEAILIDTRIWYRGNVDAGVWHPTRNLRLPCSNYHLVKFEFFFRVGTFYFFSRRKHLLGFRFLNLAFAHLQHALRESHPCLVPTITAIGLHLMDESEGNNAEMAAQLYQKLFDYLHEMTAAQLNLGHPLTRLWSPLAWILKAANSRDQLRIITQLIKDISKTFFDYDCSLVYDVFLDCWEIESEGGYVDFRAVAERDCPNLLSAIDSGQELPGRRREVMGRLTVGLGENLVDIGRQKEATKLMSKLIANPNTPSYIRCNALGRLSRIKMWQGDRKGSLRTLQDALQLADKSMGERAIIALNLLRRIIDCFKEVKDWESAAHFQVELERRIRLAEEKVGIPSVDQMMCDLAWSESTMRVDNGSEIYLE